MFILAFIEPELHILIIYLFDLSRPMRKLFTWHRSAIPKRLPFRATFSPFGLPAVLFVGSEKRCPINRRLSPERAFVVRLTTYITPHEIYWMERAIVSLLLGRAELPQLSPGLLAMAALI